MRMKIVIEEVWWWMDDGIIDSEDEPFADNTDNDSDYVAQSTDDNSNDENDDYLNLQNQVTASVESDNNSETVVETEIEKDIRKPRKRVRKPGEWKATKRMKATLSGKEHKSKSGKLVKAKSLKPGCRPCKKKCTLKIVEDVRLEIFNNYWNDSKSWDLKRQFILSHVRSKPISRSRPSDGSRNDQRKQTILYDFEINSEKIEVCKVFFLNTLGISETVVRNILKKRTTGGFVASDMRGRHIPPNKLSEDVLNRIRSHIKSFPNYPSHYSREKTSKKYLGAELNQQRMYMLYKLKCEEEGISKAETAKFWAYKRIFQTEFNIGFKTPSNDTCDKCDNFHLQLKDLSLAEEERTKIQQDYDNHLEDAEDRYCKKREDKEMSKNLGTTKVIMLDLQKCLPTPYLSNAQSFYSLKLWTLNLTVYDATAKKSYCMVWDESQVGRRGHEIASALLKWAEVVLKNSLIETLIIWSDNCPSQNRNIMMMINYFWLLNVCPSLKTVTHKFLLRGHTHLEADHVHGLIERTLKKRPTMEIITPWDWQQLIRSTGATVYNMNLEDFKNFEILYSQHGAPFVNRKLNTDKENFLISSVVCLEACEDSPGVIFYKTKLTNTDFKKVVLTRTSRATVINLPQELPANRKNPKGVSKKKYSHLITLLQWVPVQFHEFYRNLPVTNQDDDDEQDDA